MNSRLEEGQISGHLLGDSRYGIKPYLLTPYPDPDSHIKKRYNKRHSKTRIYIEKAFGCIKRRFPLLKHGYRFRKAEDNCLLAVVAFTLYNMIFAHKNENDFNFENDNIDNLGDIEDGIVNQDINREDGIQKLDTIADGFLKLMFDICLFKGLFQGHFRAFRFFFIN